MGIATGMIALMLQAAAPATPPPAAVTSVTTPTPMIVRQSDALVALLRGTGEYETLFAPSFRAAIPKAQFDRLTAQVIAALGQPTRIEQLEPTNPLHATLKIGFERGVMNADIVIAGDAPYQITGLLFKGAEPRGPRAATIDGVIEQLATLPGTTVFALARLGDAAPKLSASRAATTPIAIGSAFKLVILAELVRSIEAGERKWSDVVTLDGSALPGGGYAQQPKGTRIPLRALAERMISVSDNSATDILLFHLGRQKVEAMLPVVGFTDGAPRNVPFLGALELFKLKGVDGGALGARYLALPPAARRAFLDGTVRDTPIAAIPATLFQNGTPLRIAELEWFASPNDLIRALDWLRRHMDGAAGADLRAILSKNPGLPDATGGWRYVGYKGGSEPGVLTMAFLLQGKDGTWHALAGGVNDPARDVDTLRFTGLMGRALELAAPR
ncbi:serine hydrolase [Sphingomonas sp. 2R-10]|uniref:serine hydrolase n=1 Tax=Sphingomonas sp. 2R-10 TaxID=3045148 RepID=UPI000F795849|nr:serine hydrolase [Sphingomonas sp. 2R-10]MDJ0277266.1 serine hydrolase [Sphingomonas sp. 2R-10]